MQLTERQSRQALSGAGLELLRPEDQRDTGADWYLGLAVDRVLDRVTVVASSHSGVTASGLRERPAAAPLVWEHVDAGLGMLPFQARNILAGLALPIEEVDRLAGFLLECYYAMVSLDGVALEIRRCSLAPDGVVAEGLSLAVEDNALWRRPELAELVGLAEEFSTLPQAARLGLRYRPRPGDTGVIVTGTPLGVLTSDYLKRRGLESGPQVDLGPDATSELAEAALSWVLHQPRVRLTVINALCGLNRADRLVDGFSRALAATGDTRPVVIRVAGFGDQRAWEMVAAAGAPWTLATTTQDLTDLAAAIARGEG